MSKTSLANIQEYLNGLNLAELAPLNISILRNTTLESIEPYLRYSAAHMGCNGIVRFGRYDNIFQEAVGGQEELFNKNTDAVLVFSKLENLSWDLARNFIALSRENILSEVQRIQEHIQSVLTGIRRQTNAMLLWHSFELPVFPNSGIMDSQNESGQCAVIRGLNDFLRQSLQEIPNAYVVDLNLCLSKIGAEHFYDPRYWHIGRVPYSARAFYEIASLDFRFLRALKGKNKKCLILDCDNVLWGGIISEDGMAGVKLSKTSPGSVFYEFQKEVLNLYHRGIILALCSKNNQDDVWDVFRDHPDMVLKEEHITAARINWQDKASNLREIAEELNIALDSMVFVDDSDFETNLIRELLPEVETLHLPVEQSVNNRDILAGCGWFDGLVLSQEDKKRGVMMKADIKRRKIQNEMPDLESYYRSLEMILEIRFADEFSIPRIAQLTQKTNQFNFTTRRYTDADIKNFCKRPDSDVLFVRVRDRFGDMGIVGVCILVHAQKKAVMDTFLMSCRVLGRCIEDAFLMQALKLCQSQGCEKVVGTYIQTRKNSQVKAFYPQHGFRPQQGDQTSSTLEETFGFELNQATLTEPVFFKSIDSEVEEREKVLS